MRTQSVFAFVLAALGGVVSLWWVQTSKPVPAALPSLAPAAAPAVHLDGEPCFARLPAAFVPNLGQWHHAARYVARFGRTTVFLEADGWTLAGLRLFAQFVWLGPGAPPPCPPLGLSASNGLDFTIQP